MTRGVKRGSRVIRFDNARKVPIISSSEPPPSSGWAVVAGGSVVYRDGVQVGHSANLEIRSSWRCSSTCPSIPIRSDWRQIGSLTSWPSRLGDQSFLVGEVDMRPASAAEVLAYAATFSYPAAAKARDRAWRPEIVAAPCMVQRSARVPHNQPSSRRAADTGGLDPVAVFQAAEARIERDAVNPVVVVDAPARRGLRRGGGANQCRGHQARAYSFDASSHRPALAPCRSVTVRLQGARVNPHRCPALPNWNRRPLAYRRRPRAAEVSESRLAELVGLGPLVCEVLHGAGPLPIQGNAWGCTGHR
jgi:hypothetical protein